MKVKAGYLWNDRKRTLFGLPWSFTRFFLTEEKLIIKTGLFSIKTDEVRLYRILDMSLSESFSQRIFNLGTVKVMSEDASMGNFNIKNIKNPENVYKLLSDTVEAERVKKRTVVREVSDIDEN